jgi:hypothetical protein
VYPHNQFSIVIYIILRNYGTGYSGKGWLRRGHEDSTYKLTKIEHDEIWRLPKEINKKGQDHF